MCDYRTCEYAQRAPSPPSCAECAGRGHVVLFTTRAECAQCVFVAVYSHAIHCADLAHGESLMCAQGALNLDNAQLAHMEAALHAQRRL